LLPDAGGHAIVHGAGQLVIGPRTKLVCGPAREEENFGITRMLPTSDAGAHGESPTPVDRTRGPDVRQVVAAIATKIGRIDRGAKPEGRPTASSSRHRRQAPRDANRHRQLQLHLPPKDSPLAS
jgi:hypothetical protein